MYIPAAGGAWKIRWIQIGSSLPRFLGRCPFEFFIILAIHSNFVNGFNRNSPMKTFSLLKVYKRTSIYPLSRISFLKIHQFPTNIDIAILSLTGFLQNTDLIVKH